MQHSNFDSTTVRGQINYITPNFTHFDVYLTQFIATAGRSNPAGHNYPLPNKT